MLREAIERHAAKGRTAIILAESGEPISYGTLLSLIDRYSAGAQAIIGRGELVGVMAPRGVNGIAAFFGLMQAGACPCFIEPRLPIETIADRMRSVGMQWLMVEGEQAAPPGDRVRMLASLLQSDNAAGHVTMRRDDRAMMLFTSGSSGRPKGVLLSHGNLASNARGVGAMTGLTPIDRLLHVMPLHHTNGVNNQLILPFLAGASIVLAERFIAEQIPDLLLAYQVTCMTGVPTMFSRLLPHMQGRPPVPSLRFLRCGSAPISDGLLNEIEAAFGVELLVSYGLSEATCTSTMNPPGARRIGSVGKVLAGQLVKLFKPGTLSEAADGEDGEICISGPSLMQGYLGDAEAQPIEQGWLRSGDLGRFDRDGYLFITGRSKDVIIRGGENLFPAVIEAALASHPAVLACCVVGQPDADLGEVPVAFVVPRANFPLTAEILLIHLADRLPRACAPAAIHLVAGLPEIGVGKIDRQALRRQLEKE